MAAQGLVVYPNVPVRLVVLAVGFPEAPISNDQADALRESIRPDFPLCEQHHEQRMVVDLGGGTGTHQELRAFPRFSTRDRKVTMAVTTTSVVIEARAYESFGWYQNLVRAPLEAVGTVVHPDGVTSIGHRFIDEVHLPSDSLDLDAWFDPALLAMPNLVDGSTAGWQAVVSYRLDDESQLTFRYGPIDSSLVASPDGKVRIFSAPVVGLDWDSNWQPRSVPEFDATTIVDQLATMYQPVRDLFRRVCTEQLRRTFEAEPTEMT